MQRIYKKVHVEMYCQPVLIFSLLKKTPKDFKVPRSIIYYSITFPDVLDFCGGIVSVSVSRYLGRNYIEVKIGIVATLKTIQMRGKVRQQMK